MTAFLDDMLQVPPNLWERPLRGQQTLLNPVIVKQVTCEVTTDQEWKSAGLAFANRQTNKCLDLGVFGASGLQEGVEAALVTCD